MWFHCWDAGGEIFHTGNEKPCTFLIQGSLLSHLSAGLQLTEKAQDDSLFLIATLPAPLLRRSPQ
jgi:hypothetical protein